ncbi:hypothetical protein Lal_00034322 [Lupinus albus]|uniref:Uncharacterized protein n=1 Tax=Lupinus albus TaxID=3870 RepID=A0A6A4QU22_LUPAL|nr:hypothetical protein Lalb_Chr03g0029841 [Lupinus albus]KAF1896623.1 hypothetical protein Lal_00034322 [Lupinus albus]
MDSNAASTSTVISEESNKENIPPLPPDCKSNKAKGKGKKKKKKKPIQSKAKGKSFKKKSGGAKNRNPNRIPLTDITDLVNNSSTSTPSDQQELIIPLSDVPSPSIPRRKKKSSHTSSKSLRMGFR